MTTIEILRAAVQLLDQLDEYDIEAVPSAEQDEAASLINKIPSAGHALQEGTCDFEEEGD